MRSSGTRSTSGSGCPAQARNTWAGGPGRTSPWISVRNAPGKSLIEDELVQPAERARDAHPLPAEDAQRRAGQRGDGQGGRPGAAHLPDGEPPPSVRDAEHVTEVAAGHLARAGQVVRRGQLEPRHPGQTSAGTRAARSACCSACCCAASRQFSTASATRPARSWARLSTSRTAPGVRAAEDQQPEPGRPGRPAGSTRRPGRPVPPRRAARRAARPRSAASATDRRPGQRAAGPATARWRSPAPAAR